MAEVPIDEFTKTTLVALIARWQHSYFAREQQEQIKNAATKKAAELDGIVAKCRDMCRSLGFDREDKELWASVLKVCGPEAMRIYNNTRGDLPEWKPAQAKNSEAEPTETKAEDSEPKNRPPIKDICLERLLVAGAGGQKASDIRDFIQKTYPDEIHEKTVGMTLYRLLKDGQIRREGHKWFAAPQTAGTANPGAQTPGSMKSAK